MTESDKKYYERKGLQDEKRKKALTKARARGEAAVKWMETNKLTPQTKPEFDKLMRDTNELFDQS